MNITENCFNWSELVLASDLPSNAKFLALYLSTYMNQKNNIAWPSQARISRETGLTKPTIRKYLAILEQNEWLETRKNIHIVSTDRQGYLHNEYHIRIPNCIKQGVTCLPPGTSRGKTDSEQGAISQRAGGKELTPNNKGITIINNKGRFTPPTIEEVKNYCLSRDNKIDPEKFINHYETTNWFRGKTKIKSWKACVRTWESNHVDKPDAYSELLAMAI